MKKGIYILIVITTILGLHSCKKQQDSFSSAALSDYYPLQVGKYITYKLDSTLFINFGQRDTVTTYQVQDRIEAQITDNLNRPAYRIVRYIRRNASQGWVANNNTFMVIPTENTIELVENNLRFQKLKLPIRKDFSWKGNSYIDTYTINSEVKYLDDWDYTYDSLDVPLTLGAVQVDSTIKVAERDEFLGQDPHIAGTLYAEKNYGVEKYAKQIGLVYKEFLHWEYQGSTHTYTGYGVKLTMIDHN
ncbi:MAG: hypothetical protein H0W12_07810 [Chitinophagaceae bacterium]|nr:hypothetical protein [Chitinophagaceae bacterium]